ncbi:MAG: hypothetical protein Q8L55_05035 [Phycisphaerales bacterium]|nr:hypothetical protein [Phycisphaerales bacterium]
MYKAAASTITAFVLLSGCASRPAPNLEPSAATAALKGEASPPPPATAANQPTTDGFAATVNRYCPIMQRSRLNATSMVDLTVEFEGQTVGLCCEDCRDGWQSMDDNERRERLKAVLAKR